MNKRIVTTLYSTHRERVLLCATPKRLGDVLRMSPDYDRLTGRWVRG